VLPKFALTHEGRTALFVPGERLYARESKMTSPAFFNPAARVNRDVSIAIARATGPRTFLDALAGVGARGIRVANESSGTERVTLVEFNSVSIDLSRQSARENGVESRCDFVHSEANAFLHSRFGRLERFDAVDIDPFGTPAPYVQGALAAADEGAIVSMTATDTATLCGVFPSVAARRYGARTIKGEFAHEAAIRMLLGFCARIAGIVDTAIYPLAAHSTLHYLRVYFRVARGAAKSDRCLENLGCLLCCDACHEVTVVSSAAVAASVAATATTAASFFSCPACGGRAGRLSGPEWIGPLVDDTLLERASADCQSMGWRGAAQALEAAIGSNSFPPFGFSIEAIASREKVSSVKTQAVLDSLTATGHSAMRHPFEASGLKTSASYEELRAAVMNASARSRR
jgi:tRNA (guanine26-N2/guanine27-N2)-dimethyltransferase